MPNNILDTAITSARIRQSRFSPLSNAINLARQEKADPALAEMGLGISYDEKDEQKQEVMNRLSQIVDVRALGLEPQPASSTNVAPDVADVKDSYFTQTVLPNAVDLVVNGVGPIPGLQDVLDTATRGMGTTAPMDKPTPQIVGRPTESGFPTAEVMMTTPEENIESLKYLINNGDEFIKNQPLTASVMGLGILGGSMSLAGALKFKPHSYLPKDPTKFFEVEAPAVMKGDKNLALVRLPDQRGLAQLRADAKSAGKMVRVMRSKDPDFPGLNVAVYDAKLVRETLKGAKSIKGAHGFIDEILAKPEVQKTSFFKEAIKPMRDGGVVLTPEITDGTRWGDMFRRQHTIMRRTHPAAGEEFTAGRHAIIKNRVLSDAWTKIKNDFMGQVYSLDELGSGRGGWTSETFGKVAAELDQKAARLGEDFDIGNEIKKYPEEVQAALRQHKQLTDSIASRVRREMLRQGVPDELVAKWGRDGFYLPKLFQGNYEIKAKAPGASGVDYVTRAQTMGEAYSTLNDLKKKGYTLERIDFDNTIPGELAAQLPRGQLERLIATLKKNADVDRADIMEWFKGKEGRPVIGAKESRKKGLRFKEGRVQSPVTGEEYPFWNTDYDKTMNAYFQATARYLAMNEFGRVHASVKARVPSSLSGLHKYLDDFHQDIMGRSYAGSRGFDNSLKTITDALNSGLEKVGSATRVGVKPMAMERWLSQANKVMANIKLSTPAAAVTNGLQTFQTLYPRVSTGTFISAWKDSFTEAGFKRAQDAGVLNLPAKLQDISFTKSGIESEVGPLWAFNKFEQRNRVVAYLAGEKEAKTTHGRATARAFGMDPNDPNFIRQYAIDMVAATQFDMSMADLPKVFRHPVLRTLFQFKPFQNAFLGSVGELRKMPDPVASYAKGLGATAVVGGLRTVVSPVRLAAIYGISKAYDEVRKKHGEETADALVYGLPGLIGMDMSGRIGVDLVPAFGHTWQEKLVNAITGPTAGQVFDLVEFSTLEKKDKEAVYAYLKRMFPQVKMGHSLWNAIKEDKWLRDSRGKKLAKADPVDRWLEALAFNTIKRTQANDVRYELDKPNPIMPEFISGSQRDVERVGNRIERYTRK